MGIESSPDVWAFQYTNCIGMAKALSEVMMEYRFQDVCMGVFCINSWCENRSAQECILGLNSSLMVTNNYGTKTIETYEEFTQFFRSIRKLCKPSALEDYVLPIMGQMRTEFEGQWYPVILGCGMVQEYPRLCFGEAVCAEDDKRDEYRSLLSYVAQICEKLEGGGWTDAMQEGVQLVLPPKEHWERTRQWFTLDSIETLSPNVLEELSSPILPIEMRHFVQHGTQQLPLFNPSILADYLLQRIISIGENRASALVEGVIATEASKIFGIGIGRQKGCLSFPVFRHDGAYAENCPCTLLLFDECGTLTLFYNLAHGDGNLQHLARTLRSNNKTLEVIDTGWPDQKPTVYGMRTTAIKRVTLVAFVNNTAPALYPKMQPTSELADITCGALDLLTILQAASSVEEVNEFFAEAASGEHKLINAFSGIAPHFLWWKDNNRSMLPGAKRRESVSIWCDYNDTDRYYHDFFRSIEGSYPITGGSYTLGSPFRNTYEECDRDFIVIRAKSNGQYLGVAKGLEGDRKGFVHIFAAHDYTPSVGDDGIEDEERAYTLYEDLIMCMVNSLESGFARLASMFGDVIQIGYVTKNGGTARQLVCVDSDYGVYGFSAENKPRVVLFSVDASKFIQALTDANDRSVECRLVAGILSLLPNDEEGARNELIRSIQALANSGKMVDVQGVELPYAWSGMPRIADETDVSRAYAIRAVATSAAKAGVCPGTYYGQSASEALRSFQEELTATLKHELSKYDSKALLMGLYAALAQATHDYYIHSKRFGSFGKVDKAESQRIDVKTFDLREAARHKMRAARYCIETLLCYDLHGDETPDISGLSTLVSLANQLVSLCDEADILHFAPPGFGIEVDDDFIVNAIEDDSKVAISKSLRERQLLDPGHLGGATTEDIDHVTKAKSAFLKDTGMSFECFLDVLNELALDIDKDVKEAKHHLNVVLIGKRDLEAFLTYKLGTVYEEQELKACIAFITLDPTGLRVISGRELDYLPFGRIKDRPNRLELKPIVALGGKLLFAPTVLGMLRRRWISGIAQRFLPVKDTFNSLYGVICQWKRHFEKSLENDAYQCFIDSGYGKTNAYKGLELKKKGKHPEYLGDYDVLAYDQENEIIWAIECKEFEKVESAFDYMQLQERWFGRKGLLSKFERRIDYLKNNTRQVANDMGFNYESIPEVRALLVCNKLFDNLLGTSSFEVVTLNELKSLI